MCWGPQDHSFFCQDLTNLYQFAVDGSLIKQCDIGKLTGGGSMSSGTRLDVSPNGRRIIFDVDLAEESHTKELGRRAARNFRWNFSILKPIPPRA